MQKYGVYIICFFLAVVGCLMTFFLVSKSQSSEQKKIAYVNSMTLFESFDLTKELKVSWEQEEETMNNSLDSSKIALNRLEVEFENGLVEESLYKRMYQRIYQAYLAKEKYFSQRSEEKVAEYDEQVINRLNQYIKEFGKEKGYDFILGQGSSGSLLYAPNQYDITEELIVYANKKYSGE